MNKIFPAHRYLDSIQSLEGVEVGDRFLVYKNKYDDHKSIVVCTKVTPKQAQIGEYRYRIKDACALVGKGRWRHIPNLYNATPEEIKNAADIVRKKELLFLIKNTPFSKYTNEQLETVRKALVPIQEIAQ